MIRHWFFRFTEYVLHTLLSAFKSIKTVNVVGKILGINIYRYPSGAGGGAGFVATSLQKALQTTCIPFTESEILALSSLPFKVTRRENTKYAFRLFQINARQTLYLLPHFRRSSWSAFANIGYWFWELEKFPERYATISQYFHEIWVPSAFVSKSLSRAGLMHAHIIPPIVDTSLHSQTTKSTLKKNPFTFLFAFDERSYVERKNPMSIIDAFKRAFGSSSEVCLLFIITSAKKRSKIVKWIKGFSKELNINCLTQPFVAGRLRSEIQSCDAYVSLHRSEGFGMTIAEAMAMGKPVIATAYSGNMDYTTDENSYLVQYQMVPIKKTVGPYEKGNVWAEPDIDHAAELMRRVFENHAEAEKKGLQAASDIKRLYSAERVGSLIKERLLKIYHEHGGSL